jgi:hypothetical protein
MKSTKSIRFAEDLCIYHAGAVLDMSDVDAADLWYQVADLLRIKRKALVLSKQAVPYGMGSLLTNTYGKTDTDTMEAIIAWAMSCDARRGLERFLNKEYAAKRIDIRRRTIQSVLTAQRKLREEGIKDTEYTLKILGRLSEAFSQDSSRFASVMGAADRAAAEAGASVGCLVAVMEDESRRNIYRTYSPHTVLEVPEPSSLTGKAPYTPLIPHRNSSVVTSSSRGTSEMRHYY